MADHSLTIFCAIVSAFAICCCFILYRKNKKTRKELFESRKEQELLISEFEIAMQELEDSKEQLFQNNRLLKDLLSTITHDIQSPLKFIHLSSKTLDEIITARDFEKIDSIPTALRNSVYKILVFVSELSHWIKSIDKDYKLPIESVNVYKLIEEIKQFFEELLKDKNNIFSLSNIDQNLNVLANRELLKIILRNIIDNANKNSSNSLIQVSAAQDNKHCTITIADSGTGILPERLDEINHLLTDKHLVVPGLQTNEGHGYKLIAHFSKLMGITVTIDSKPGNGTKVELRGLQVIHNTTEYISNNFTHP